MQSVEKLLIKIEKAAAMLDCSKSKIYTLVNAGEIPSVRLGGAIRIPLDGLRKMIAEASDRGAEAVDGN